MTKIEAIKKTIFNLENNVIEYNWKNPESCNCGVLARTLLNGESIWDNGYSETPKTCNYGVFSSYAYCLTTNLPLPKVFQLLKDAGFTHNELLELEYYGNEEITKRLGRVVEKRNGYPFGWKGEYTLNKKGNAILYFKTWLQILEEKEVQPKPLHIYHAVQIPETLVEKGKELVTLN